MNADQLKDLIGDERDPEVILRRIVDRNLATLYNNDLNAYVDALGRNVDAMLERGDAAGILGALRFLHELETRGADQARVQAVLDRITAAIEAARAAAAPKPEKATGARRIRTKTGRRVKKGTRRGRTVRS